VGGCDGDPSEIGSRRDVVGWTAKEVPMGMSADVCVELVQLVRRSQLGGSRGEEEEKRSGRDWYAVTCVGACDLVWR
jgi:hypothetical protein